MPDSLLQQALDAISRRDDVAAWRQQGPATAIVLGTGLGSFAEKIQDSFSIPYDSLPGMPSCTAAGHRGAFLFGQFAGQPVVAMAGRLHRYEGHSRCQLTFPIELMLALEPRQFIASNAAGGLRADYSVGDLLVIRDWIDWLHQPLDRGGRGLPEDDPERQQPPLNWQGNRPGHPETAALQQLALQCGQQHGFAIHQGTYLATLGPNYETRAECRMMRRIGADVVGMSTVPELILAKERGFPALGVSVITNLALPDRAAEADHSEVLLAGRGAADKMELVVRAIVDRTSRVK